MTPVAVSGPMMAPVWSRVLWSPKASPLLSADTESLIRASLGAVLMPFPTLSATLMSSASVMDDAVAKKGLTTLETE